MVAHQWFESCGNNPSTAFFRCAVCTHFDSRLPYLSSPTTQGLPVQDKAPLGNAAQDEDSHDAKRTVSAKIKVCCCSCLWHALDSGGVLLLNWIAFYFWLSWGVKCAALLFSHTTREACDGRAILCSSRAAHWIYLMESSLAYSP